MTRLRDALIVLAVNVLASLALSWRVLTWGR